MNFPFCPPLFRTHVFERRATIPVERTTNQSPDEVLLEGAFSACRSIVWFGAFALFYSVPWSGASLPIALTAGVAALLFNLLFHQLLVILM